MKLLLPLFLLLHLTLHAQNPIFVDARGIMRWTATKKEAAFFGVNYTTPFAYSYRAQKKLGVDLRKAIDADVYHLARLGIDAFRVHVWDVEISDSAGNLLANEHLDLFDYLLSKLEERKIHILITPIAFWGNGYPDPDEQTPGFSTKYGKRNALVNEDAIRAQETYLRQFFQHVNPYTKRTYAQDRFVVAMEINNEPQHWGPKAKVTEYVNRLAAAVRSTGWTKPVFYNISESPDYADAVVAAKVDGHSFQWYPTGLVAGFEQKGNFLPHVDKYRIPFLDTIPAFRNRARMVYEFDAGDVLHPIMYPAMARSFRTAGFQWATQFAYDPLYLAPYNTEYQTHYLNLVYTPAKAISLLIASKAFHQLPRGKSWGRFPQDTVFGNFRVSYRQQVSEMNGEEEFYYTSDTRTRPKNLAKLQHLAGVGSSPLVRTRRTGAYFLDQVSQGAWRLEVYPDVTYRVDPFGPSSLNRLLATTSNAPRQMEFHLPGLGADFDAIDISRKKATVQARNFALRLEPGVYLLTSAPVTRRVRLVPERSIGFEEHPVFPNPVATATAPDFQQPATKDSVSLFNPGKSDPFNFYVRNWKEGGYRVVWDSSARAHRFRMEITGEPAILQIPVAAKVKRLAWPGEAAQLIVRGQSREDSVHVDLMLITSNGSGYHQDFMLTPEIREFRFRAADFIAMDYFLLPKAYPRFQNFLFKTAKDLPLRYADIEQVQIYLTPGGRKPTAIEIVSIQLKN